MGQERLTRQNKQAYRAKGKDKGIDCSALGLVEMTLWERFVQNSEEKG